MVCERCGERPATTHIAVVSSDRGRERNGHFCAECFAVAYPKQAAGLARSLAKARREALARPIDFDALVPRLRAHEGRLAPHHLAALADQLDEQLAANGQSPPEYVRRFIGRYRSSPPAV
jgi:protein-arginine kinase activator protein McsA